MICSSLAVTLQVLEYLQCRRFIRMLSCLRHKIKIKESLALKHL
jgi:hypothetical protein